MRHKTYYVIAALLVLATVPMYRYTLNHAREVDHAQSTMSREHVPFAQPQAPLPANQPRPLLAGEICKAGLVLLVGAGGYVPAKDSDGVAVHCKAGHVVATNDATDGQGASDLKNWYAYDENLPDGYKCAAADGPVYRTRVEKGATVIEPLVRGGVIVRCGGDERSSHR